MTVTNVTPPVVTGTPTQGQTLHTSNGTWTYDLDQLTYAYQWQRCDAAGASCVDITGATNPDYVLQGADVGSTIRSEVTATESTPSDLLSWEPPGWNGGDPTLSTSYPGYTVINLANNGSNREPALAANTDYFINIDNFDCAGSGGGIFLAGGRNIVIVGGRIYASGLTHYLALGIQNPYGTVHIEGVDFDGPGLSTCIGLRTNTAGSYPSGGYTSPTGATVQIQNCRIYATVPPGRTANWEHPDTFQFEGNGVTHAFAGTVRMDMVTMNTCQTGFNAGTNSTAGVPSCLMKRTNNHYNTGADGTTLTAYMTQWYRTSFILTVEDWYGEVGAPAGHDVIEHCLQPTAPGGRPVNGTDAPVRLTDGLGAYAQFPAASNLYGKFREGNPPGGDYCPDGIPGSSYTSPGYA